MTDVPRGRLAKPLEDIAFSLPPGGISDIISTPHGFWILRLDKRTSAHTRPFEQIATEVARAVAAERSDDLKKRFDELTARLRREVKVEIDEAAVGPPPAAVAAPRTAAPGSSR